MRVIFLIIISVFIMFNARAESKLSNREKSEIEKLLNKQVESWNEGNLEKFMETYWKSDDLSFVGSEGPIYGWESTLERYRKGYPDKQAMGRLKFTILKVSKIDKRTILVIGRFDLSRESGDLAGHYTLVIQKIDNNWIIISDHSSAMN